MAKAGKREAARADKKRRREPEAPVPASSSTEESDSDSSDDETENALFRPATTASVSDDDASNSDEAASSSDDESEADEKDDETQVSPKPSAGPKPSRSKETSDPAGADKALEGEIARKTEATVYVEGIPYKADEGDVVSHFSSCGSVKEVRMPRYQDSGKPRGYAHVVFDSANSVAKALKLDGKYLLGRYLTVKKADRPRSLDVALQEQKSVRKAVKGCRTVFVKHLPYDVEETTIREALASCGTITSVRLPLWNHTKKLKGFGYVEFSTEDEAVAAVRRSGMKIGDRMVIISLETAGSAPKASFRMADGRFWNKGEEAKQSLAKKLAEKAKASDGKKRQGVHPNKKQKSKH